MGRIGKTVVALIILSNITLAQVTGGGAVGGGLIGGGKAEGLIVGKISTVIDKKVFNKLAQQKSKNSSSKSAGQRQNSTKSVGKNSTSSSSSPNVRPSQSSASKNLSTPNPLKFQPLGETGFDRELVDLLTNKADEKEALLMIFKETKKAYQEEAKKLGRENDIALATTFFITSCLTVYHQTQDPPDEATDSLYALLAESMLENSEITQMSNREKHLVSDKLIYVASLIYMGNLISKQNGDEETAQIYRRVAAECFQSFTGLSADNYIFEANGLAYKP